MEDKDLPQEIKDIIAMSTHTVALIKNLLKYGSIVLAIVTMIPILVNIRYKMRKSKSRDGTRTLRPQELVIDA